MKFLKNKLVIAIATGALFTLIIGLLAYANVFVGWQLQFSDLLYSSRPVRSDIVLVTVDDRTLMQNGGLGAYDLWTRTNFAKVLENINKFHPKVVGFDFFFIKSKDEAGDLALRQALEKNDKTILTYRSDSKVYDSKAGYYLLKAGVDRKSVV